MATQKAAKQRWLQAGSYDQKLEQRATKHECLRDRNNITTCRSPGKQRDAEWRSELQRKRQMEFLKRRQIGHASAPPAPQEERNREPKVVLRSKQRRAPPVNRRSLIMAQDLGITWPDMNSLEQAQWLNAAALRKNEDRPVYQQTSNRASLKFLLNRERFPQQSRVAERRDRGVQTDQSALTNSQHGQRDSSSQTECGLITVQESDILQLADYLKEALWREETLKQKLALLQHSASALLGSFDNLWMTRCNEDILKSRIGALESQLQVCAQKFPRDGVKKVMLQMEEQRRESEEKALEALQRATTEKAEAEKKAESLEEALQAAQAELERWRGLYGELKESCGQLRRSDEESTDQLHLLQSQLERARGQEADLRAQLEVLQRDGDELRSQITLLEDDNQATKEQLNDIRVLISEKLWQYEDPSLTGSFFQNPSREMWDSIAQFCVSDGRPATAQPSWEHLQSGSQLQDTQQKLRMKEKECEELRAELDAMELECHTSQSRLSQCREELKLLSTRRSKGRCCSWLGLSLLLVIMVAVVTLAWICFHPVFGNQLQEYYGVLREHVEQYLWEAASSENSECYRPI
ncbi:TRAF3-interacting JNK-activating modulator [Megalops cyprinoides]|uniref:TRAF3-interacting JNK-activating modulator n=1 Tax=Megalops cyprinoides TaxID=118141 RepID=UPI0018651F60|nr:TRAF3-interacting JNK-activating modulator [Megalops cyprinoides]